MVTVHVCIILPHCFFFLCVVFLPPRGGFLHFPSASSFSFMYDMISFILLVVCGSFSLRFFFFFHFPCGYGSSSFISRTAVILLLPLSYVVLLCWCFLFFFVLWGCWMLFWMLLILVWCCYLKQSCKQK